jgi:uncharacterized protein DUF1569
MSAHQMVCHLADAFRGYMGLRPVTNVSTAFLRRVVRPLALWVPLPWPHGFRTAPELDQQRAGTKPGEFDRDVDELLRLIARISRHPRDFQWQPHPLFGELSESDWMRLVYLHTVHHLRQFGC